MGNIVYYIFLVLGILTNASGGLLMKFGSKQVSFGQGAPLIKTLSTMVLNWQLILGILLYGLSFAFTTIVYTKISLNVAYPVMVGTSFLLISLASVIFLSEKFTTIQVLGSVLLICGIIMIAANLKGS